MKFPQIDIIILNWNGANDTIECLESVFKINYPNYNVILIDNCSEDDSIEKIKKYCNGKIKIKSDFFEYSEENKPIKIFEYFENESDPFDNEMIGFKEIDSNKKIIIIKNFNNKGYADGNNVGMHFSMRKLDSNYIMILNNDIVVDPNFLNELVIVAEKKHNIGIIGPTNLSYNKPDEILSMGVKMNFWTGGWTAIKQNYSKKRKLEPIEADFVGGAAIMIKREVIDKIGVFYSPYFANWEETDYCILAKKNGYRVFCAPESKMWHKSSSSISIINPSRIYLILRNNILFMRRNAKARYFPSFILFYLFVRVPSFIYWGYHGNSTQNSFKIVKTAFKAIYDGIRFNIN